MDSSSDVDSADSGDSGDSASPEEVYCRSLDPNWAAHYVDPVDQELALLIARAGLEGDPAIYVDTSGKCRKRPLPAITDPLAELGRALFFSMDLSGDKNVACASCHHPELGGGDAISLSIGPTDQPNAMGADRVRGLDDVADIHVPRNAQTTFNVAFWDDALFWDSRVQALDPTAGFNGENSPITTPDAENITVPAPAAGANLTAAQAWFPVTETHEMAGSWGDRYDSRDALRGALAERMAQDSTWVQRFSEVCTAAGLPATWSAACALTDPTARAAALVSFPHIAHAIGEYERSQIFTDSPWKAYVQGDTSAISEGAKQGALRFFQTVDEGGQNCFTCHKTDFFTDEKFHAVGSPQLGPGKEDGTDLGRARLTGDAAQSYTFRTATLLNVEHTAPYFHSGAYVTLAKAVGHYDNPNGRIFEYFGEGNKSDLNIRPWCEMEEFANIPSCNELYSGETTHGGRVPEFLDPEVDGIKTLEDNNGVYIEAFLRTLTDPRVADPAALAAWVEPSSSLEVTDSSYQWDRYCDSMIERAADMNLHNKGFRWMVTGAIADGEDVNTNEALYDQFGVHYWELFSPAFTANSGVDQSDKQLAIAMMEVLQPAQRQLLYDSYAQLTARGNHARILTLRQEVFERMNDRRSGLSVEDSAITERIVEAGRLEAEDISTMVQTFQAMRNLLSSSEQDAQVATFRAISQGDLSSLPAGVYNPGDDVLTETSSIRDEIRAASRGGTIPWDGFAASFLTWSTGWDCQFSFMSRLLDGDRRANYYGFSHWASRYLFDLQTGKIGSGDFELEMSDYVAAKEAGLGLDGLFSATLEQTRAIRSEYDSAREELIQAMIAEDQASAAQLPAAEARVIAANEAVATQDAQMLLVELDYYVRLWQALQAAGDHDLEAYLACIEDPATQAMQGNGGFDALGGGTCQP